MAVTLGGGGPLLGVKGPGDRAAVQMTNQVLGITIPISSGQRGVWGRCIWASPERQVNETTVPDPSLIDGPDTTITVNPFIRASLLQDLVFAFGYSLAPEAERGVVRMYRLWLGDRKIFDAADPVDLPEGVGLEFHDGASGQGPDAAVTADLGDLAPSFPGMMYVRVSNWVTFTTTLGIGPEGPGMGVIGARTGPAIPTARAEIIDGLTLSNSSVDFTMLSSSVIWEDGLLTDWKQNSMFAFSAIDTTAPILHTFDIESQLETNFVPVTEASFDNLVGVDSMALLDRRRGFILTAKNGVTNTAPIVCIDTASGRVLDTFGVSRTNLHPSAADGSDSLGTTKPITSLPWPTEGDLGYVTDGAGKLMSVAVIADTFYDLMLLGVDEAGQFLDLGTESTDATTLPSAIKLPDGESINFIAHIPVIEWGYSAGGFQDGCVVVCAGQKVYAAYYGIRDRVPRFSGLDLLKDFGAGHTPSLVVVDPTSKQVIVFEHDAGNNWTANSFKTAIAQEPPNYVSVKRAVWAGVFPSFNVGFPDADLFNYKGISIPIMGTTTSFRNAAHYGNFEAGTFQWALLTNQVILKLGTGQYRTVAYALAQDGWAWDSRTNKSYYARRPGADHERVLAVATIGAASGTTQTIGQFCRWTALRMGHPDANIYVDPQLTDVIVGSIVDRPMSASSMFGDLGELYNFRYFESEDKVKFVRAAAGAMAPPTPTEVSAVDLAYVGEDKLSDHDLLVTTIKPPNAQTAGVSVLYPDVDRDYAWTTQVFDKDMQTSGSAAVGRMQLSSPIVATAADAYRRLVKVQLRQGVVDVAQALRLPQKYLLLEPSDTIGVTMPPYRYVIRLDETTLNGDYTISLAGVNYDFDDDVIVRDEDNDGLPDIDLTGNAVPFALDIPLIDPSRDPGSDAFMIWTAAGSYDSRPFTGASVRYGPSPDGPFVMSRFVPETHGAVYGVAATALPSAADPFMTDDTTVLRIVLKGGTSDSFESTDRDGQLAGNNAILVGVSGRWELIFFKTVEVVNDKSVKLTGLLRGRRGSEGNVDSHLGGDAVILVRSVMADFVPPLETQQLDAALLGETFRWDAFGLAQTKPPRPVNLTLLGRSAYPFAPFHVEAVAGSTINTASSSPDYYNPMGGGEVLTPTEVDRRFGCTVTGTSILRPSLLVDGNDANNSAHAAEFVNGATDVIVQFDFRPYLFKQRVTELQWVQNTSAAQGNYDFEGSDDGIAWTSIRTNFDLTSGSSFNVTTFTNANYYWFYRLKQVSGAASSGPWLKEAYLKTAAEVDADDVVLDWVRRDRLDPSPIFLTDDTPMSEATELYSVDILDGGGAVLRTYNGLTTTRLLYSAVDQVADGFTPPIESVRLKVYQISALVGRGFTKDRTVVVTS